MLSDSRVDATSLLTCYFDRVFAALRKLIINNSFIGTPLLRRRFHKHRYQHLLYLNSFVTKKCTRSSNSIEVDSPLFYKSQCVFLLWSFTHLYNIRKKRKEIKAKGDMKEKTSSLTVPKTAIKVKIHEPRSMIPVTGSRRIPSETAFFPALSCRFLRTSGLIWSEKAPEYGSSIPTGTSSYAETRKSGKFPLPDSIWK